MSEDARQYAPSAARNRDPIWSGAAARSCRSADSCSRWRADRASTRCTLRGSPARRSSFSRATPMRRRAPASMPGRPRRASPNIRPALALDAAADAWPIDARRRRRLHQHDPHLAVGFRCRPRARRRARAAAGRPAVPLRALSGATAGTRRRATRRSMRICAAATRNGACATSKPSPISPPPPASRRRSSPRCPPNNLCVLFRRGA